MSLPTDAATGLVTQATSGYTAGITVGLAIIGGILVWRLFRRLAK